jgi:hypothetical protein
MSKYSGEPMDLANMRSLGLTRVDVYCACGHQASIDVSNLPDDLAARLVDLPAKALGNAAQRTNALPASWRDDRASHDHTLGNILINFGQQLLAGRHSAPAKTEPDNPKLPRKGRRR